MTLSKSAVGIGMVVLALAIGNVWQYAVNRTDVS